MLESGYYWLGRLLGINKHIPVTGVDFDKKFIFKMTSKAAALLEIENLDKDRWPWKIELEPLSRVSGKEYGLTSPTGEYIKAKNDAAA